MGYLPKKRLLVLESLVQLSPGQLLHCDVIHSCSGICQTDSCHQVSSAQCIHIPTYFRKQGVERNNYDRHFKTTEKFNEGEAKIKHH